MDTKQSEKFSFGKILPPFLIAVALLSLLIWWTDFYSKLNFLEIIGLVFLSAVAAIGYHLLLRKTLKRKP